MARSRDVPAFGPPIPEDATFPNSTVFRDFLLAKVINAENAAHKSDKFRAMATRTRQEYLRDLAERHVTSTPIDPSGKFPFISLAHKRKEKTRPYSGAELRSPGSITWPVYAEDHGAGGEMEALLAISNDFLVLVDPEAKAVVFNCAVRDVISWTLGSPASMKIYYERGENISLRSINNNTEDFREVIKRLEVRLELHDSIITRGGRYDQNLAIWLLIRVILFHGNDINQNVFIALNKQPAIGWHRNLHYFNIKI